MDRSRRNTIETSPRPSELEPVFNPFAIQPCHSNHRESANIISLMHSGRIICPPCLQEVSLEGLDEVDMNTFDQYILSLFEALDEYSEDSQMRRIALAVLEIMLKKRSISIKSDHEFHNLISVIYKIMNSVQFNRFEFAQVSTIFSTISRCLDQSNTIPFLTVWGASQHLLNYAKRQLSQIRTEWQNDIKDDSMRFFEKLADIIKTYLHLLSRYTLDKVSDLIFPLFKDDLQPTHCRKKYKDSQIICLQFMKDHLLPNCWEWIINLENSLNSNELNMIQEIFSALRICLLTSARLKDHFFIEYLKSLDSLKAAHRLFHSNPVQEFQKVIKEYLREYVRYFITSNFESDSRLITVIDLPDSVVTNHTVAMNSCLNNSNKSIFYLLLSNVANSQGSRFYNRSRVISVLKLLDPTRAKINKSRAVMRVYLKLVSLIFPVQEMAPEQIYPFLFTTWEKFISRPRFNEMFCFEEKVFFWELTNPQFHNLIKVRNIRYIVERVRNNGNLVGLFLKMLQNEKITKNFMSYFEMSEDALSSINDLVRMKNELCANSTDVGRFDLDDLISKLAGILPAILHRSILRLGNETSVVMKNIVKSRIERQVKMISVLMINFEGFDPLLDEQSIKDTFQLIGQMYASSISDSDEDLLVSMNEFLSIVINSNHLNVMSVLKHIDFYLMGFMFHQLCDYRNGDMLSESIAKLLLAYDNLDYPLDQDISFKLFPLAQSALNWMLSSNSDLHILSLRLCQKVLGMAGEKTTRICLATGLIHMLVKNPQLCRDYVNQSMLNILVFTEEFLYHPMLNRVIDELPRNLRYEIDSRISDNTSGDQETNRPLSPTPSFSSVGSDQFRDEHASVENIISRLVDNESFNSNGFSYCTDSRIPNFLLASQTIQEHPWTSSNPDEWERIAYQCSKD